MNGDVSGGAGAPGAGPLSRAERAELEQLRAELARLRAGNGSGRGAPEPAGVPGPLPRKRARRWLRGTVAVLLIGIATVLSPLSVISVWARGEVSDTDRYVATIAPLADDPAIQQAVTANLTNLVFQYVDVQGLTRQAVAALAERGLPANLVGPLQALAVPLANGVRSFTADQIGKVVSSDVFAQAWVATNRVAHQQLVAALTGRPHGAVGIAGDAVTIDLATFLGVVKQRLVDSGFQLAERIPTVHATVVLFESSELSRVQRGFDVLNKLGRWLPVILVALAGLGIYLAPDRRTAFIGAGLALAAAMLGAATALAAARHSYLHGVPADVLPPDAAAALFDTVIRFLRDALRAAFLIGLLVAAGAFLTGPARLAVAVRRWLVAGFARLRSGVARAGLPLAGVTGFMRPRARLFRVLVVAAAFAVLLVVRYRTPELVGWLTVAVLAALAAVQLLATEPR